MRFTLPRITRILLVLLTVLSVAYQATAAYRVGLGLNFSKSTLVPWVSLTPQSSWKYPWVYATATFAEQNLFTSIIAGATLFFGGRYLERAWGEQELAKFIALLTLVPNLLASILYLAAYTLTGSKNLLNTSIQGSIAIQAGFLVTFKQLVPEHTVSLARGAIRIRVKHFTAIFLLANTISGFVLFTDTAAILSWLGFLTSWTYLRFYQCRPDDVDISASAGDASTARGDASETFAFAYFWPDKMHAPIAAVSDWIYNVLVAIGLCTPFSADEIAGSTQDARVRTEGGLPTVNRTDNSERRRAIALQALNERLAAARQGTASAPPPPPPRDSKSAVAAESSESSRVKPERDSNGNNNNARAEPEWSNEQP